jgi:hypothetical protein
LKNQQVRHSREYKKPKKKINRRREGGEITCSVGATESESAIFIMSPTIFDLFATLPFDITAHFSRSLKRRRRRR